ncbi:hypothetical protein MG296_06020 [Flavobacteriaceae bacterium TK19130]|nr:hypothetical protein [Thermobacterium salinum]
MKRLTYSLFLFLTLIVVFACQSQTETQEQSTSNFWQNVRFGGGLGLAFGNGFFMGSIAPSAVYDVNPYFSVGPGLLFSYQSDDTFRSTMYGGSIITLFNPIREIQLSAELEQLRVNQEREFLEVTEENNFWNTALFIGGGFRTGTVTVGARYNVLFKQEDDIYASAWGPFVRVYF